MPKTIAVVWSNRSEEGLLRPVIEELKKRPEKWTVEEWKIPDDIFGVAEYVAQLQQADGELPDLAITPYDRPPVTLMAFFLYHVNLPLVQLHAGDISSGTFDDMDRWSITAWAKYLFCAGDRQALRVKGFLDVIGREKKFIAVSGVTNLDDLDAMTEPPDGDYDIVLYNPPTAVPDLTSSEVAEVFNRLNKKTYWLVPNGDPGSVLIEKKAQELAKLKDIEWTANMPHEALLGLMSRAKRVIGNSSSLFFEAPYFGCEVVQIGERNRVRENVRLEPGGSKRIVDQLEEWTGGT